MSKRTVVVHTGLGDYEGSVQDGVLAVKGIPYALPPFGPLRFRAPAPVPAHDGVLSGLDYGPTAPKPPYPAPVDALLAEPDRPGLDCLNLNVWTPESALTGGGLPVLVWIHGGAFVHGSGSVSTYDGSRFARDGVVCVTINYRLGVDGFLLLDGRPANRGLLDQVAALEWVRDQIAGFGGDPGRVTVAGESAGAMSISTLLAMPRADGLFQQAITESGAAAHVITEKTSRRVTAELARTAGIEPTPEAFAALDLDVLVETQERFRLAVARDRDPAVWAELVLNSMPFEPTVDGDVLPGPPLERIRAGAGAQVRLLSGTNREEMTLFLAPLPAVAAADAATLGFFAGLYGLGADQVAVYAGSDPGATPGQLIIDVTTDWFFRIPAIRVAEARSGGSEAATYLYEFEWRSPQWDGRLGATHALEVPFVFDTLDDPANAPLLGSDPPQALADQVHAAWVRFVTTGDPGWPAYGEQRQVQTFGERSRLVLDPRGERRRTWEGRR